jgi:hypothetical protein
MPTPDPSRARFNVSGAAAILCLGLLGFLAYVVWALRATWKLSPGVHMSGHGWAALILAFVLTGLLGGGLMWLAFYSSRKGYDEGVANEADEKEER